MSPVRSRPEQHSIFTHFKSWGVKGFGQGFKFICVPREIAGHSDGFLCWFSLAFGVSEDQKSCLYCYHILLTSHKEWVVIVPINFILMYSGNVNLRGAGFNVLTVGKIHVRSHVSILESSKL